MKKMQTVNAQNAGMSGHPEIAFLVYTPMRKRRADNSFDGNDNIGAKVVEDTLRRAGHTISYCSPETAIRYRVVLVSLTSTYDVYAYYRAVALRPSWQPGRRTFIVIAGGFGMQNPTAIRHFIDYAVFGRAEGFIASMIDSLLGGGSPAGHPSIMHLPDISPVVLAQAEAPYPHTVSGWKEDTIGCPLKCKFCHFTFARKYLPAKDTPWTYIQTSLTDGTTPEITWDQLFTYDHKPGRLRVAIDGFSQRLRYIYGKRISNADLRAGVEMIGRWPGIVTLLVYNIANMPTEQEADRNELYEILRNTQPSNRVIFVLHSTPFRPSLATPMQWEAVNLFPDISRLRQQVIVEKDTLRAVHSYTLETPWSHLLSIIAERSTPQSDRLFHLCAFSPSLQRGRHLHRLRLVQREFDLTPYLKQYEFEESHPAWFLRGYLGSESLRIMAAKMRADIRRTLDDPGWTPGKHSLVQSQLQRPRVKK